MVHAPRTTSKSKRAFFSRSKIERFYRGPGGGSKRWRPVEFGVCQNQTPQFEFSAARMLLHARVVLLVVDLAGQLVLLMIQLGAVGGGQVAIVARAHAVFFLVQRGFFRFQIGRFSGGQLAAVNALGDAVLLIFLALV